MTQRGLTGRLGVYRVRLRQPERRSGDSRPFAHKKSKDQREIGVHEPGRRFLTDPVAAIETEIVPKAPRVRPTVFRGRDETAERDRTWSKQNCGMATVHTSIKLLANSLSKTVTTSNVSLITGRSFLSLTRFFCLILLKRHYSSPRGGLLGNRRRGSGGRTTFRVGEKSKDL